MALVSQHAGKDKWEAICKEKDNLLHARKWKGQSNFPLEKLIQLRRNALAMMTERVEHASFQLPNDFTRVGCLLDAIENDDPKLEAAIDRVRYDASDGGKRSDFELCAACVLPQCPVVRRRTNAKKRASANVSSASAEEDDASRPSVPKVLGKNSIGKQIRNEIMSNKL